MPTYVIYDTETGAIKGSLSGSSGAIDIAANTPAGMVALAVDPAHSSIQNMSNWHVVNGALAEIVPTDAELLASAQATQLRLLTANYNAAKTANVPYMNTEFMGDADSQQTFANAFTVYNSLGATPDSFFAVDFNYVKVPMTLAQLHGLVQAYAAQILTIFQKWVAVRQALSAATTVADVQAVVW